MSSKIAVIYEGEDTEPRLFENIENKFFRDGQFTLIHFPAAENIHMLAQRIKDDEYLDIIEVIREHNATAAKKLDGYTKDDFDRERFVRIREIAAEMVSMQSDLPLSKVKDLFCNETGFQTPKLDTRAAIFDEDRILLVREKNGTWSLPGGWVDVTESVKSNTPDIT